MKTSSCKYARQHYLFPPLECRLHFNLHSWYHWIISSKMSSLFTTLFLVPLHSFVNNIVFIFHLRLKTTNVFNFHFILGTTVFTTKCRFLCPNHLKDKCIFIRIKFKLSQKLLCSEDILKDMRLRRSFNGAKGGSAHCSAPPPSISLYICTALFSV